VNDCDDSTIQNWHKQPKAICTQHSCVRAKEKLQCSPNAPPRTHNSQSLSPASLQVPSPARCNNRSVLRGHIEVHWAMAGKQPDTEEQRKVAPISSSILTRHCTQTHRMQLYVHRCLSSQLRGIQLSFLCIHISFLRAWCHRARYKRRATARIIKNVNCYMQRATTTTICLTFLHLRSTTY
jgi:hypothetical protein